MTQEWRVFLYPLGFLAAITFGLRMILQWLASEKHRYSYTPRLFWQLSLLGNMIMVVHTIIQIQYPLSLIQASNAVIGWRHLYYRSYSLKTTWIVMVGSLLGVTLLFYLQGLWIGSSDWIRTPVLPWTDQALTVSWIWPFLGFSGTTLFGARFFFQWWRLEQRKQAYLGRLFWWSSLVGAFLALIYFLKIHDWVNIIGYGSGIFPYIRNLILIKKNHTYGSSL